MKKLIGAVVALALSALVFALPVSQGSAQVPSNPAPYNVDLGALITNSLRAAGTVTTEPQTNTNWRGVVCTWASTASSGSTSSTFSIQGYDAATLSWLSYVTSGAILANPYATAGTVSAPVAIAVYPGIQTTSLPTSMVAINLHLPRTWRVSQTVAAGASPGAAPAVTSKVGCNYLL